MKSYRVLKKNPFHKVLTALNQDNRSDQKVMMVNEINMSICERIREDARKNSLPKPSYTALVARAVALSFKDFPYANRIYLEWPFFRRMVDLDRIDISVAVEKDLGTGFELVAYAATIPLADQKSLAELTDVIKDFQSEESPSYRRWLLFENLINTLPGWLSVFIFRLPFRFPSLWVKHRGGPCLISSPAKYGVDLMAAHWAWPLGFSFGFVKDRPIVINGELSLAPTMNLTMSFDRCLMAGAPAARFFKRVSDRLEQGDFE